MRSRCCNITVCCSVAYCGCEVLRREVEVQQVRVKEKVSYVEAVKRPGQNK